MTATLSRTDKVIEDLRQVGNVAYGALETAVGLSVMGAGIGVGGLAILDGARRIYRQAPQKIRDSLFHAVAGHDRLPQNRITGIGREALKLSNIGVGVGVTLVGGIVFLSSVIFSVFTVIITGSFPVLPMIAGAALMLGGALSTAKRSLSFLADHGLAPQPPAYDPGSSKFSWKNLSASFNIGTTASRPKPTMPVLRPPAP